MIPNLHDMRQQKETDVLLLRDNYNYNDRCAQTYSEDSVKRQIAHCL